MTETQPIQAAPIEPRGQGPRYVPTGSARFGIAATLLVVLACSAGGSEDQPGAALALRHEVAIEGLAFVPDTVRAAVGDTIVWTNKDIVPHTATAAGGSWDSELMNQDAVFTWVVTADGAGEYLCTFHPVMRGWILVNSP